LDIVKEYFSLIILITSIYINFFILTPVYLTKNKVFTYIIFVISILFLATFGEYFIIKDDIIKMTESNNIRIINDALNWNFFGIFFRDTLFVAFFTMFKIYLDAIKSYKLLQEKTDLERINYLNEIEMVKSKINTHFFFNTLYKIHNMAVNKSEDTPNVLEKLTKLLEYVVVESEDFMVPLEKEISFLKRYIELEKVRRSSVNLIFDIEVKDAVHFVPPMIFESFVNNAFKYNNYPANGLIYIKIISQGNDILFICENEVDKSLVSKVKSTGKGIRNTKNRLNLHYKNMHNLEIEDNETNFKVKLLLNGRFNIN